MENYIVINGKKVELTEEQLKALGIKIEENDPFELELGEYFYINPSGEVIEDYNSSGCVTTEYRYNVANYCKDEDLMEQRALHETLNRLLWRYSMQHGRDKINWIGGGYKIYYNHINKIFDVSGNDAFQVLGAVYFYDEKTANDAIDEIVMPFMKKHPNTKW